MRHALTGSVDFAFMGRVSPHLHRSVFCPVRLQPAAVNSRRVGWLPPDLRVLHLAAGLLSAVVTGQGGRCLPPLTLSQQYSGWHHTHDDFLTHDCARSGGVRLCGLDTSFLVFASFARLGAHAKRTRPIIHVIYGTSALAGCIQGFAFVFVGSMFARRAARVITALCLLVAVGIQRWRRQIERHEPLAPVADLRVRHHITLVKKKVGSTILWTTTFSAATLVTGMVGFAVLDGMRPLKETTILWVASIWMFVCFAMPVLGLILSVFGVLPGTRYKRQETLV